MLAIVLHLAGDAATPALWSADGMGAGLAGDELLLDAGQEPLAFGQGQAQAGQVGEVPGLADLQDIGAVLFSLGSEAHQSHDPSHVASTPTEKPAREYRLPLSRPQSSETIPSKGGTLSPEFDGIWRISEIILLCVTRFTLTGRAYVIFLLEVQQSGEYRLD